MASFDGQLIFGRGVVMEPQTNPRDDQRVAAPGVNGVATLDLGGRGRITRVTGLLVGANAAALNAAELLFSGYWDGQLYTLVDTFGNAWPYVKLVNFRPQGRVRLDSKWGYVRNYEAEFFHVLG